MQIKQVTKNNKKHIHKYMEKLGEMKNVYVFAS